MGRPAKLSGSGGQILVQSLLTQGADQVFCVPGESHLAVLDALYDARDRIKLVVCRQEGGASNMADACGKLTGRPGIALVTRGPGACNASIGIHTAFQDSTPLLLLVGQVPRGFTDREAFQEIDYRRMFGQMAKWVAQIDDPRRVPEYVRRAFQTATSGRPRPVVLALPEDMLDEDAEAPAAPTSGSLRACGSSPRRARSCVRRRSWSGRRRQPPPARTMWLGMRLWPCRGRCSWRRSSTICAYGCLPRRSSRTAPATSPPGCIGSIATGASSRNSDRPAAQWGTECRRQSRRSPCTRTGSSSRSPATGTSS